MRRSLTIVRKKCSRYRNSLRGSFRTPHIQTTKSAESEEDQPILPAEETRDDTIKIKESGSKHVYRSNSLRSFTRIQDAGNRYLKSLREDEARQSSPGPYTQESADSYDKKEMYVITDETLDDILQAKHENTSSLEPITLSEMHPALRQQKEDENNLSLSIFKRRSISGPASIAASDTLTKQTDSAHPSPNQLGKHALQHSSSASKHQYSLYPPPHPPPTSSLLPPPLPQRSPLRQASRYHSPPSSAHTLPKSAYKDLSKFASSSNPRSRKSPYIFSKATSKLADAIMQLSGNDVDLNEVRMARADTPDWLARISKEDDEERGCAVPDSPTLKDFLGRTQTAVKLSGKESSESTYSMPESTYVLPNSTYVPPEIRDIRQRSEDGEEVPVFLEKPEST